MKWYILHKILFNLLLKDARIVDPAENWMFQGNIFNFENLLYMLFLVIWWNRFLAPPTLLTLKMMFQPIWLVICLFMCAAFECNLCQNKWSLIISMIWWRETHRNDVTRQSNKLHDLSHLVTQLKILQWDFEIIEATWLDCYISILVWWMWSCLPIHQLSYISFMFPNTLFFFLLLLCSPTDIFISSRAIFFAAPSVSTFKSWIQPRLQLPRKTKHLPSDDVNYISRDCCHQWP